MKTYVLDTSALITLRFSEPGMDTVRDVLHDVGKGRSRVLVSTLSQLELFYLTFRHAGKDKAYRTHLELKMLPVEFVSPDEEILLKAGEFKAECAFPLADALIAATAFQCQATLIHKDPEFDVLETRVAMLALPLKSKTPVPRSTVTLRDGTAKRLLDEDRGE